MSALDSSTCTEACGWVAAVVAALAYGSYGVPIKHTKHIDVHPFVFQSYKTIVMFVSCWFVAAFNESAAFTNWGLLSGTMWILGGIGGIYGIRMAGLAIAVGTWASIMVMINFFFGIIIFEEPVANVWGTLCSFVLLIVGLVGMSHYSSPYLNQQSYHGETVSLEASEQNDFNYETLPSTTSPTTTTAVEESSASSEDSSDEASPRDDNDNDNNDDSKKIVVYKNFSLTERQCGILGATMNGFMTGGSLIPLHYAAEEGFGGANYFFSFGVGAMIANTCMWIGVCGVCLYQQSGNDRSLRMALEELPKWHCRALWLPGLLAGLLLSTAMFATIITITYLGQGVGNSIVQSKILISGLWGIFWYKEILGAKIIAKWFAAACCCMVAIIWLSLERLAAKEATN